MHVSGKRRAWLHALQVSLNHTVSSSKRKIHIIQAASEEFDNNHILVLQVDLWAVIGRGLTGTRKRCTAAYSPISLLYHQDLDRLKKDLSELVDRPSDPKVRWGKHLHTPLNCTSKQFVDTFDNSETALGLTSSLLHLSQPLTLSSQVGHRLSILDFVN